MGRSVSTPSNAVVVAYNTWEIEDEEIADFAYDVIEDLQQYAPTFWPSLRECDKWIGREDRAVLENDHAYVGVSEYCGLLAYWIVPKDSDQPALAERWCQSIGPKFEKTFGKMKSIGRASNGEQFFRAA